MNDEQYKRFRKMQNEPIDCLFKTHDKNRQIYFLIKGSTTARYKVTITPKGTIKCSCPDFTNGAKKNECVCKHCLFVIFKVLKVFTDLNHTFFKRCYFTPDEIKRVHGIYKESLKQRVKD